VKDRANPYIRSIEHGTKICMNHLLDEPAKAWEETDINAKGLSSKWLQDIVKRRSPQKAHVDFLNLGPQQLVYPSSDTGNRQAYMGRSKLELHLDFHYTRKCHILDHNRYPLRSKTLTNTDFKNDLTMGILIKAVFRV